MMFCAPSMTLGNSRIALRRCSAAAVLRARVGATAAARQPQRSRILPRLAAPAYSALSACYAPSTSRGSVLDHAHCPQRPGSPLACPLNGRLAPATSSAPNDADRTPTAPSSALSAAQAGAGAATRQLQPTELLQPSAAPAMTREPGRYRLTLRALPSRPLLTVAVAGNQQPSARQPSARQPSARQPSARQPSARQPSRSRAMLDSRQPSGQRLERCRAEAMLGLRPCADLTVQRSSNVLVLLYWYSYTTERTYYRTDVLQNGRAGLDSVSSRGVL